jgi:predicted oxidoreductase
LLPEKKIATARLIRPGCLAAWQKPELASAHFAMIENKQSPSQQLLGFPAPAAGLMNLARWGLTPEDRVRWINGCLERGVTVFDHADIYGDYTCENLFGEALRLDPALRKRMRIVTKCGIKLVSPNRPAHLVKHYDSSLKHIVASVDNSLRALATDRIDLLLIHRPDPLMDADEAAGALAQLRRAGKVLEVGVSNFSPSQVEMLASRMDVPLAANQVEFSVLHSDPLFDGTLDQCQRLGMAPMAWSPLAGGRLLQDTQERTLAVHAALQAIGEELGGARPEQVAIAWITAHPAKIVPVLGTGSLERIANAVAATRLALERQQWYRILTAILGHPVP